MIFATLGNLSKLNCSRLSQKLLLIVVIFALLSITQAKLGSALAYRKNSSFLIPHS
jgi:hypothetical protein